MDLGSKHGQHEHAMYQIFIIVTVLTELPTQNSAREEVKSCQGSYLNLNVQPI